MTAAQWMTGRFRAIMPDSGPKITRRIFPTRFGQMHLRSKEANGVPLVLLHLSPRSGAMWESLQERLERPSCAPDRLGYGFSDAPPWALTLEQYAQSTVDTLKAAEIQGPVDILGIHTGSMEAIEVAHQLGSQVRHVIAVGMPLFSAEEQQRQLEKYSEQPLRPVTEGGHVLGAWRGGFAFRQPPYDLSDVHRRFVEHVLAANPGAAFRAACGYAIEKKLKSLKAPLTVFAPHDDIIEQTQRVKSMLKADATYVDLPELGQDPFHVSLDQMVTLVNRHLPA
ncbi:MAG TPA: alpha/beta hydrolase [Steroidobacteraceae bacterium]|jgi:pimeloyl-ACP methyl ester carboxylesterase|nr:alpha/beta hydrolase [Steroidobacteraceae bacterium]